MSPIPVLLCGKWPTLASAFSSALRPDYEGRSISLSPFPCLLPILPFLPAHCERKVVHVCHTLSTALSEIPALLRGEVKAPSSNLGSNSARNLDSPSPAPAPSPSQFQFQFPRAIVVGKGFSESEVETMRAECEGEGVRSVPWLVPDDSKMTWGKMAMAAGTGGTALPMIIAARVKVCLKERGMVPGMEMEVDSGGGVWGF